MAARPGIPRPTEALAVRMAAGLRRSHGESSIAHAYRLFERAAGRQDIARADLYHAVWSALRYGERAQELRRN
ncbi:hypothetical protein [Rhizorhabdus dicambivorans]|uniref:Uncharacterized protein n=1 Tax=Rhizorhabdus dicambivorans TaxID=1850238 RepID=A0A2A4G0I7_9SPHN|nr:hypothetical protein [Rhizorhabdus dicambivorans]ATE63103.1 hypothetical protein CMV14_00730 [Rhizorhabdus dicambivorans]PCE43279.1 hypothetical protein COO09_05765 [Rhizorhabdus dicambivorans]